MLELPAGMIDEEGDSIAGTAVREMEEECGIALKPSELLDLTELGTRDAVANGRLLFPGIAPSPGGCDEFLRILYVEKTVSTQQLQRMKGRLGGLQDEGEMITLHVVPFDDVWRVSGDSNAMCGLFLLDQLRKDGRIPAPGVTATPMFPEPMVDVPTVSKSLSVATKQTADLQTAPVEDPATRQFVPALAFGMYKVPDSAEGEAIIADAIRAGYRHFDTASYYGNEALLGKMIEQSSIPRDEFFICSKIWNDAQKNGREAVRASVKKSIGELRLEALDVCYIHWPVPDRFVDTYKELEALVDEGLVKAIGISNFGIDDFEVLLRSGIRIKPLINQFEVSPAMFRPHLVQYFEGHGVIISSSKALHRGASFNHPTVTNISDRLGRTPAQVFVRWGLQKGFVVVAKTQSRARMEENRDVLDFVLGSDDVATLDAITTEQDVVEREALEKVRKSSL